MFTRSWTVLASYWKGLFATVALSILALSFLLFVPGVVLYALELALPSDYGVFINAYSHTLSVDYEGHEVHAWRSDRRTYAWYCVHLFFALVFASLSHIARSRTKDPKEAAVIPKFEDALWMYMAVFLCCVAVIVFTYVLPYMIMLGLRYYVLPSYVDQAFNTKVCTPITITDVETYTVTTRCCSYPYDLLSIPAFHAALSIILALLAPLWSYEKPEEATGKHWARTPMGGLRMLK